ncbi:MAG: prolyl oligopeptidase family serine peptidase [Verrucomicrobiales bacterium]|nr:prolyl oligopeptidase family serine peptidase [Verrucomicrobiales bacterium]
MKTSCRLILSFVLKLSVFIWVSFIFTGISKSNVYKSRINAQWSEDKSHFWYRNDLAKGQREFILVDMTKGIRRLAFDHKKLAASLSKISQNQVEADKLPIDGLSFDLNNNTVSFRVFGQFFICELKTHELTKVEKPKKGTKEKKSETKYSKNNKERKPRSYRPSREMSPDGNWRAFVRDHNVFIRATKGEEEIQLSKDGKHGNSYEAPYWAPNSKNLFAFRIQPGAIGDVHLVESSPKDGGRANLRTRRYPLPGDKFTAHELNHFDIEKKTHTKPEVCILDFRGPRLRWTQDGRYFRYQKIDRGHQRFRVIEVDTFTGKFRNIIDEVTETFIWTEHPKNLGVPLVNWLDETNEIIYLSEKDGWRHIYLIDAKAGKTKNPITKGDFVVRYVDWIDKEKRQIWFRASGLNKDQDPYLMHYYRVNFDGSEFTALTDGNGWHNITYSPDRKYIIDQYSRVDMAPVHDLRRVSDGSLVCELEKADITELEASGWKAPEVFRANGRDGKTGIWGIIARPKDFDPKKKYPVLEDMYAGPHDSYVPKQFSAGRRFSSWTDMGFVVVKIDGMGTANRSKAFHDVCWQNLKDAGFPDRILWHKAYAEKNRWYDISRVGIHGGSAGGQSSTGALLFHPEFYKVAVSSCGCHDNRMDKASWNEQWMGYPVGPHYSASSNIDNANRLRGRLLLIVGELDTNVPPESTLRLVHALIRANKDFDMIVVPGGGHGDGGRHGDRRRKDFFRKYLLGIEPPNYNLAN